MAEATQQTWHGPTPVGEVLKVTEQRETWQYIVNLVNKKTISFDINIYVCVYLSNSTLNIPHNSLSTPVVGDVAR